MPYVVPVAAAAHVFDADGGVREPAIALQLKTLGIEVVRVSQKFSSNGSLHRQAECDLRRHYLDTTFTELITELSLKVEGEFTGGCADSG